MTYLERAQHLAQLIGEGKSLEALDTYYADDLVVIEGNGDTFKGKETQRGRIKEWMTSVKEMHAGGLNALTSNEDAGVTMSETWFDATFHEGGRFKMEEVAVQYWEGDKIVKERFYYNAPG